MAKWFVGICLCLAIGGAWAQENDASKANELYQARKKVDAPPLYEELAKSYPNEMQYQERLADCLDAESAQLSDPVQIMAVRTRMRDAAKRAVELGDKVRYIQVMAEADPNDIPYADLAGKGAALLREGEKAYSAGDFTLAMQKYTAAAEADPQLYDARLYAGDTAYVQKDLPTAANWFARAIDVNPDRETAYRYWGDAILKLGNDPDAAKSKFIEAIVAEPYSHMSWQGVENWTARQQATLIPPKIDLPAPPQHDPKKPKNITINIDPNAKEDASAVWLSYQMERALWQNEKFAKEFPGEKTYRHSLREEDSALTTALTVARELKTPSEKLDESLRNLLELQQAGMLDCWILINAADNGIAEDYAAYRKDHRQLLHDYLARFVIHGGITPSQE